MRSNYVLTLALPEGKTPRKPPVVKQARLANGKAGPAGRLTVYHGDKAIRHVLSSARREAATKKQRLYRVDLGLDLQTKPQGMKPSLENLGEFVRLDLSLMTGDLRRAFMERAFGRGSAPDIEADDLLAAVSAKPEVLNAVWKTKLFRNIQVFTWPAERFDLATRRAVIRSTDLVDEMLIFGYPQEFPLPVIQS